MMVMVSSFVHYFMLKCCTTRYDDKGPGTPNKNSHFENFSLKKFFTINQSLENLRFGEKSHVRIFINIRVPAFHSHTMEAAYQYLDSTSCPIARVTNLRREDLLLLGRVRTHGWSHIGVPFTSGSSFPTKTSRYHKEKSS